ncbi:PAS domain S-box-containing protein/diguanylate cyclase (GGDEF) domain-containing protein [Evansella caseinilytica]|uniref:PAS domain S-box-containing protein/diguanylate cyclase (GGDEF) domain-containing protein n=1 Tax=Evansella caseinilytica TaxID=1503961 RepID=A0A1H3U920_9BACI|nr:diguanylate cyclase [Evansella caseinilytica]SDZ58777.1 PAS domain S-box-containing protein/diguanylate cyclase (GGDEF) domain-containing protein [Evansella caseinilytica]
MERLFTTNREEFVRFINYMQDMIFIMEVVDQKEFRYTVLNSAAKQRLNIDDSRIIGKNLEDVMPETNARFIKEKYRLVLNKKEQLRYEYSIGDDRYEESILNPIINKQNEVSHIISVTRDISTRKLTERKLMESEERYRLIAENSKALIQLLTKDGNILYASPSHSRVIGVQPEELLQEPLGKFMLPDEWRKIAKVIAALNKNGKHMKREIKTISRAGEEVYLSIDFIPIVEAGGKKKMKQILVVGEDITERKIYEKQIHQMAYYDHLTGLPNIQLLRMIFNDAIENAKKNYYQVALLYLDCDQFKLINDTYGHGVGDLFLKELAGRIRDCFPSKKDVVSRVGGDEFNIVLNEVQSKATVDKAVDMLFEKIREPWFYEGTPIYSSVSIGISLFPINGTDMQTLVKKADDALYIAKKQGRNRAVYF